MEGNLPFLLCFTLYLRAISTYKPSGTYRWRGFFLNFTVLKHLSSGFRGSKFLSLRQKMPLDPRDKLVLHARFYRLFFYSAFQEKSHMQGTSRGGWLYPIPISFLRKNLGCIVLSIFRCLQWFLWVRPLESSGDMAGHCGSREISQSSMLYRRFWPGTIWSYRDHQ